MRVCHVTNNLVGYHKAWGGAEQAADRIIRLLEKNGIENMVLATKPLREVKESFEFYSVPVIQDFIGEHLGSLFKRPYDLVAYNYCYNLLKEKKPDLVLLYNFGNIGFGVILAAKKLNIPVIFIACDFWFLCPLQTLIKKDGTNCTDFHSYRCIDCLENKRDLLQKISLRWRKNLFDKYFFSKVDRIIVLADYWKDLLKKYGLSQEKIKVIPLPLKKERVKKEKVEKDSILYTGWIVPRKGLHIVLEAMPEILKKIPNIKLYVIGENDPSEIEYKNKIDKIISENKLEKNVFLLGKKPYKEVQRIVQKSELVVVPEQWQIALSTFMNEAMIYGKPVVASRIGGIPEYLQDGKCGLLAEPRDSKDFAQKIINLLKNKQRAKNMGRNAALFMSKKTDERKIFDELNNVYKDL
ncbi:MAG: glycosyltransferase family 4 protein [archaeon]